MSNSLDPDQEERSAGPDLGPNSLHLSLTAEEKIAAGKERDYITELYNFK